MEGLVIVEACYGRSGDRINPNTGGLEIVEVVVWGLDRGNLCAGGSESSKS